MKEKNEKYKFKENTCTFDHVFFIIQKAKYYELFLDGNIYIYCNIGALLTSK